MVIAIHQPHYFPWLGYFDKIAKSDIFVILDKVQLEKGSQMIRNRVISDKGEVKYLTISADTKNFLSLEYKDIIIKNPEEWKTRQLNALRNYYRTAPFLNDGITLVDNFFQNDFPSLCEWTCKSIELGCDILGIKTELRYQSDIEYEDLGKKSDLVLSICKALGGTDYLSGRGGSVNYLNRDKFANEGINIVFQDFEHPQYNQCSSQVFVPGLSILDVIMNCGMEGTKNIFWRR